MKNYVQEILQGIVCCNNLQRSESSFIHALKFYIEQQTDNPFTDVALRNFLIDVAHFAWEKEEYRLGYNSALSREKALREALREIVKYTYPSEVASEIARQALEGEEPKEVTREELAEMIHNSWDIEFVAHQLCEDIASHLLSRFNITERRKG